jgi:hypothetical protein
MTTLSTRIFSINDMTVEKLVIPEWDGIEVEIRSMSALEKSQVTEQAMTDPLAGKVDIGLMYALSIIQCLFDPETGEQIFQDSDVTAILSKSNTVIERLAQKIMGNSGMGEKAVSKAQERFPAKS